MAAAKKSKSTAMQKWDEELAKYAAESAKMEANVGGGQFFSVKSGVLSWQDNPMPNNEMGVIIVDSIMENAYYDGEYDPSNPQPPLCFAFGRSEDELVPHERVVEAGNAQSDACEGCQFNEFGSADKGRGKACKNTRRLALLPAGKFDKHGEFELFDDTEHFESTEVGFMKLPVTSIKGYATFVKQVAATLKRPPFGIVTKIKVVPDPNSQFKVIFEAIGNVPDELMSIILKRHEDIRTTIDFPYDLPSEEEVKPKGKSQAGKKTGKPAPKKASRY